MNSINELEDLLYRIIGILNDTGMPLIFKGGLVVKQVTRESESIRYTNDIDCDWVGDPPDIQEIENGLNAAIRRIMADVSVKRYRDYIIGKRSAGFHIMKDGFVISSIDMSIKSLVSSKTYYYGEITFTGYDLYGIVADKIEVVSTPKIFRRTKDLFDLYNICISNDFEKALIIDSLNKKNKVLSDFSAFKDQQNDLLHSYTLMKGITNKPDFSDVYGITSRFVDGLTDETSTHWDHSKNAWR